MTGSPRHPDLLRDAEARIRALTREVGSLREDLRREGKRRERAVAQSRKHEELHASAVEKATQLQYANKRLITELNSARDSAKASAERDQRALRLLRKGLTAVEAEVADRAEKGSAVAQAGVAAVATVSDMLTICAPQLSPDAHAAASVATSEAASAFAQLEQLYSGPVIVGRIAGDDVEGMSTLGTNGRHGGPGSGGGGGGSFARALQQRMSSAGAERAELQEAAAQLRAELHAARADAAAARADAAAVSSSSSAGASAGGAGAGVGGAVGDPAAPPAGSMRAEVARLHARLSQLAAAKAASDGAAAAAAEREREALSKLGQLQAAISAQQADAATALALVSGGAVRATSALGAPPAAPSRAAFGLDVPSRGAADVAAALSRVAAARPVSAMPAAMGARWTASGGGAAHAGDAAHPTSTAGMRPMQGAGPTWGAAPMPAPAPLLGADLPPRSSAHVPASTRHVDSAAGARAGSAPWPSTHPAAAHHSAALPPGAGDACRTAAAAALVAARVAEHAGASKPPGYAGAPPPPEPPPQQARAVATRAASPAPRPSSPGALGHVSVQSLIARQRASAAERASAAAAHAVERAPSASDSLRSPAPTRPDPAVLEEAGRGAPSHDHGRTLRAGRKPVLGDAHSTPGLSLGGVLERRSQKAAAAAAAPTPDDAQRGGDQTVRGELRDLDAEMLELETMLQAAVLKL